MDLNQYLEKMNSNTNVIWIRKALKRLWYDHFTSFWTTFVIKMNHLWPIWSEMWLKWIILVHICHQNVFISMTFVIQMRPQCGPIVIEMKFHLDHNLVHFVDQFGLKNESILVSILTSKWWRPLRKWVFLVQFGPLFGPPKWSQNETKMIHFRLHFGSKMTSFSIDFHFRGRKRNSFLASILKLGRKRNLNFGSILARISLKMA